MFLLISVFAKTGSADVFAAQRIQAIHNFNNHELVRDLDPAIKQRVTALIRNAPDSTEVTAAIADGMKGFGGDFNNRFKLANPNAALVFISRLEQIPMEARLAALDSVVPFLDVELHERTLTSLIANANNEVSSTYSKDPFRKYFINKLVSLVNFDYQSESDIERGRKNIELVLNYLFSSTPYEVYAETLEQMARLRIDERVLDPGLEELLKSRNELKGLAAAKALQRPHLDGAEFFERIQRSYEQASDPLIQLELIRALGYLGLPGYLYGFDSGSVSVQPIGHLFRTNPELKPEALFEFLSRVHFNATDPELSSLALKVQLSLLGWIDPEDRLFRTESGIRPWDSFFDTQDTNNQRAQEETSRTLLRVRGMIFGNRCLSYL